MKILKENCLELAEKFIEEHNNDDNWSPFDRIEIVAIRLFAQWLERKDCQ